MQRTVAGALPLALPLAAILWLQLTASLRAGDATAASLMIALATLTFMMSRALSMASRVAVPGLVVICAAGLALIRRDVLLGGPLDAPLGYSNAAGALYMLAAAAALLLALRVRRPPARLALGAGAAAFAAIPVLNETRTAAVLVCLLPLVLLVRSRHGMRVTVALCVLAVLGANLFIVAVASTYELGRPMSRAQQVVASTLSGRRLLLWRDALVLLNRESLFGVGPARFPQESPTARADRDTQWPHNEWLHFGAETGLPGLLLVTGLVGWAFTWLVREPVEYASAALGAAVLMSTAIQASVDYVLHFPAVVVAVAALLGASRGAATPPAGTLASPHASTPRRRPVLLP